jgi:hypothetical protein
MEKERLDYYLGVSDKLKSQPIDPDTYISQYVNSEDPILNQIAISPSLFERHLKGKVPPEERINLVSQFLDNPELHEEALIITLRILEKEMDDWDLYYEKLSLFTNSDNKDLRQNTYAYTECTKYSKEAQYNVYNRIPKRIHKKIINLIDNTLLNDNVLAVRERASYILVDYFRRGFFENPIEEIHKRLDNNNPKELDCVIMVPLLFLPRDEYPDEKIFNEFRSYSNEYVQMKLCEFLAFKAKSFLYSNNDAQSFMFNLLKRENISEYTYFETSFFAGKRFNSLNREFCIAIASRLEDDNDWIRGDAIYMAKLLMEDAEFRKNHPYPPYI